MGIASIVGRIAKAFKGGGRLAKNVIDKGRQIIGKVSPFIKKGFEFAQRIPGFINNAKRHTHTQCVLHIIRLRLIIFHTPKNFHGRNIIE